MIYKPFDIVDVPFPFSDKPLSKIRKALVLSSEVYNEKNGATVLSMITSAQRSSWFGDVTIEHWELSGLHKPCIIRLKIFTLDNILLIAKRGVLQKKDRKKFQNNISNIIPFFIFSKK